MGYLTYNNCLVGSTSVYYSLTLVRSGMLMKQYLWHVNYSTILQIYQSGQISRRERLTSQNLFRKRFQKGADCNRVLNVVDWHHRNGDRSDNSESNWIVLCPNCHAVRTRRHLQRQVIVRLESLNLPSGLLFLLWEVASIARKVSPVFLTIATIPF